MSPARSGPVAPVALVALVALLMGLAFTAFYAGSSRGIFNFGDDILMYQVTESIWERGEVAVTSEAPAEDIAHAVPGSDGRGYAKYGLGPSLVALPFFAASHWLFDRVELPETADRFGNLRTGETVFGTGLSNAVLGGATVAVTFLLAVELGYPLLVALATAFCHGAATLLAHYSSTFLSEPLSALCLAVALLGLLRAKGKSQGLWKSTGQDKSEDQSKSQGKSQSKSQSKSSVKGKETVRWWLALSGFASGLAVATKVAHVVLVLPLFFWAAYPAMRRPRQGRSIVHTLYWSFCFLLWIGVIAAYNFSRFGSVLETGYGKEAGNFTASFAVGFVGLLASPSKGVFWYCPVLLLAVLGGRAFWRRDRACALTILAASAAWLLLISRYYQWYGGGSWGPRFLVPLLPLWILPAAEVFTRWRDGRAWQAGMVVVVAASLVASAAPLLVPFSNVEAPLAWSGNDFATAGWRLGESPLLHALDLVPEAAGATASKLLGRSALGEAGRPAPGHRFPDFAFENYGSHALLVWTRDCFLVSGLALFLALGLA
ncbi:MAG: hypothetical protein ABIU84_15395, partial [Thermoanaerobaculia bacterium]